MDIFIIFGTPKMGGGNNFDGNSTPNVGNLLSKKKQAAMSAMQQKILKYSWKTLETFFKLSLTTLKLP